MEDGETEEVDPVDAQKAAADGVSGRDTFKVMVKAEGNGEEKRVEVATHLELGREDPDELWEVEDVETPEDTDAETGGKKAVEELVAEFNTGEIETNDWFDKVIKITGLDKEEIEKITSEYLKGEGYVDLNEFVEKVGKIYAEKLKNGEEVDSKLLNNPGIKEQVEKLRGEDKIAQEEGETEASADIDKGEVRRKAKWVFETIREVEKGKMGLEKLKEELGEQIKGEEDNPEKLEGLVQAALKGENLASIEALDSKLYSRRYDPLIRMVQDSDEEGVLIKKAVEKKFRNYKWKQVAKYIAVESVFQMGGELQDAWKTLKQSFAQSLQEELQKG